MGLGSASLMPSMAKLVLILTLFIFWPLILRAQPLEFDDGWLALLHYENGKSSAQAGAPFFLSPQGNINPKAELDATIAFMQTAEGACRFPARAIYLRRKGINIPSQKCERWDKWREAVSAKGIELVFAAAFMNSPSSMYGHTLLKFPRSGKTEGHELLDYTLSYGAETGRIEGFSYVWKGLTGGFNGFFVTSPFYLKVKEYNYVENRDFWIYSLNLSAPELELLVAHAWELKEVSFPYFFLHKNCSYYLLQFLEVARPGQNLTHSFPLWAVPLDTIRRLKDLGWISSTHYRPSRHKVLEEWKKVLHSDEVSEVPSFVLQGKYPVLDSAREPLFLDASYEFLRYKTEGKLLKPEMEVREKEIFAKRSRFKEPVRNFDFSYEISPENGHQTSRAGILAGKNTSEPFTEIQFRFALHDLLANPLGYEKNSELAMGDFRFRLERKRFFIESADLLRLRSLAPMDSWSAKTSWALRVGVQRVREFSCEGWRCVYEEVGGGLGGAYQLSNLLIFGLAKMEGNYGGVFSTHYRISFGPNLGLALPLWRNARFMTEYDYRLRILGEKRQKQILQFGLTQSLNDLDLSIGVQKNRADWEASLGLYQYF